MIVLKLCICGTRDTPNAFEKVTRAFDWIMPTFVSLGASSVQILSGMGGAVDLAACRLAVEKHGKAVEYPAEWSKFGKRAGPIRNELMAQDCDAVLAVWDGRSRGTLDMIMRATKHGKLVYIFPSI